MTMTHVRRSAILLAVVALLALGAHGGLSSGVLASASASAGPIPVGHGAPVAVPIPHDVRDALRVPAQPRATGLDALPAQEKQLVKFETFEDTTWPPEGWMIVDRKVPTGSPAQYAWGRETCDVPANGGNAGAWSAGGGVGGEQLACWAPYAQPVETWMVYQGIDTTGFAGGLSLQFNFKLDMPRNDAFRFCLIPDPSATNAQCYTFNNLTEAQRNRWLNLADPVLPNTSGLPALAVVFVYLDDAPDGTRRGAIVDNVLMEGIASAVPPTTQPGTNQPPVATRTPPPPTEVPPPEGTRIFLPLGMKKATLSDLPAPPTAAPLPTSGPAEIGVGLGLGIDRDAGELIAPGTAFQYGHMQLCQMTRWANVAVGTPLRWQWYLDDQALSGNINREGDPVEFPAGWASQCLEYRPDGPNGPLAAIPRGRWRIDVWLANIDMSRTPDASAQAVIQDEVPPGATPLPVEPSPTPRPTSTVGPTALPGTYTCRNVMVNGDFEQGPAAGWSFQSNAVGEDQQPIDLEDVIRRYDAVGIQPPPGGGAYLGILGGGVNVRMDLFQTAGIPVFDPQRVVSATLEYTFALITDEVTNGQPDDVLATFVRSQAGDVEQVGLGVTEESVEAGAYYRFRFNAIDQVLRRTGWDTFSTLVASRNSANARSVHFVDTISLSVCEKNQDLTPPELRARESASRTPIVQRLSGRVSPALEAVVRAHRGGSADSDLPMRFLPAPH